MFMTCSTSYCLVTLKDLRNACVCVCMYVCMNWTEVRAEKKIILENYSQLGSRHNKDYVICVYLNEKLYGQNYTH